MNNFKLELVKTKLLFFLLIVTATYAQQTKTVIFDDILFFDGYAPTVNEPVPNDVIRHRNDLYAKKLSAQQLAAFGDEITINVNIKAACDNYDRIGNVNLALVPKGQVTYTLDAADLVRIELGRYITPFMNKNKTPNTVPYSYDLNHISRIFKDQATLAKYDIWVELELFGVPYSAHTQIPGCAGRNDVFYGSVEVVSNVVADPQKVDDLVLVPLLIKHDLNNYQVGASDAIGLSKKTINFELDNTIYNAKLFLITSNHGAGKGGEEYVRREHYVYFDQSLKLQYKPGGLSCEPFRKYNTQPNGIYQNAPQSDQFWASWNNWCPGNSIPIRIIDLGTLAAGTHTVVLDVPEAQFAGGDGKIPVSLYIQAHNKPYTVSVEEVYTADNIQLFPNPTTDIVTIRSDHEITSVEIWDLTGKKVGFIRDKVIDLTTYAAGIYIIKVTSASGNQSKHKVIKN